MVLVGRNMEKLQSAIPRDFEAKGNALYLAKDVSTVCTCDPDPPPLLFALRKFHQFRNNICPAIF